MSDNEPLEVALIEQRSPVPGPFPIKHVIIRAEWNFMTVQERMDANKQRTAAHNALIEAVNILSRSMAKSALDNEWRRLLTDDRKVIGDFACLLVAHVGILAR